MKYSSQELSRIDSDRMLEVIVELAEESRQIGDCVAGFTYPGAWTSRVSGLGAREPVTRPLMEEIVNFYRGRQDTIRIHASPYAHPTLWPMLREFGFSVVDWDSVLVWDLSEPLPPSPPTSYTLQPLSPDATNDERRTFARANILGFHDTPSQRALDLTLKVLEHPRTEFIGSWKEQECIATAGIEYYQDSATLITGAVLPGHRRQGIQAAMIYRRLKMAQESGSTYAAIASSPGEPSERNAIKLGAVMGYHQGVFEASVEQASLR